jgi:hypothetical protein
MDRRENWLLFKHNGLPLFVVPVKKVKNFLSGLVGGRKGHLDALFGLNLSRKDVEEPAGLGFLQQIVGHFIL